MNDSNSTVSNSPPASPSRPGKGEQANPTTSPEATAHTSTASASGATVNRTLKFANDDEQPGTTSNNENASLNIPVEFVPPTEGTPAALALAGKLLSLSSCHDSLLTLI
jgi:hypothetical protein